MLIDLFPHTQATIALAESLNVSLDMRFTLPAEPIYIFFDMEAGAEYLFVISTTQKETGGRGNALKRSRGEDTQDGSVAAKRSAMDRPSPPSRAVSLSQAQPISPLPHPLSFPPQGDGAPSQLPSIPDKTRQSSNRLPLFLPGASQDAEPPMPASQLSARDLDLVRSAGLGIEHMDYEEFEAMMEAEGEEVGMSTAVFKPPRIVERTEVHGSKAKAKASLTAESDDDTLDDGRDMPMLASQIPAGRHGDKVS